MVVSHAPRANMVASYLGMTLGDNESDGDKMVIPQQQRTHRLGKSLTKLDRNPEGASLRGLWSEYLNFFRTPGLPCSTAC